MIVVDTDVLSELMRARPSSVLMERLERVPVVEQATTAITLGELAYGARKAGRPALYQRAVELLRGVRVLDFDRAAAEGYGALRAQLERAGLRLASATLTVFTIRTPRWGHNDIRTVDVQGPGPQWVYSAPLWNSKSCGMPSSADPRGRAVRCRARVRRRGEFQRMNIRVS